MTNWLCLLWLQFVGFIGWAFFWKVTALSTLEWTIHVLLLSHIVGSFLENNYLLISVVFCAHCTYSFSCHVCYGWIGIVCVCARVSFSILWVFTCLQNIQLSHKQDAVKHCGCTMSEVEHILAKYTWAKEAQQKIENLQKEGKPIPKSFDEVNRIYNHYFVWNTLSDSFVNQELQVFFFSKTFSVYL